MTFVRKWIEHADWGVISQFKGGLSINFIRQHADRLTWSYVLMNCRGPGINADFVREFRAYIHWPALLIALSRVQDADEVLRIASEFADKIDLSRLLMIFKNRFAIDPPESFLERFFDKIGAAGVSKCRNLSGAFMRRHANQLDWLHIAHFHRGLDTEFMREWGDELAQHILWHEIPDEVVASWGQDVRDKFCHFLIVSNK